MGWMTLKNRFNGFNTWHKTLIIIMFRVVTKKNAYGTTLESNSPVRIVNPLYCFDCSKMRQCLFISDEFIVQ